MSEDLLRVIVADDQDIVRDGLVTVLGLMEGIEVVGEAADGAAACDLVSRTAPDVVLMDLRMPVLDGAAATARITAEHPGTAVLVLTTFADDASIGGALRAGARGYLTKDAGREDIAAALRSVARGQTALGAVVAARVLPSAGAGPDDRSSGPAATTGPAQLTRREQEVLEMIGRGLSNAEIAGELFVSTATVKTHINNLFAKLGLRDRAQAVRLALRGGPPT
ncbi:response regulator transcription factor [Brachybacterium sp. NBEC-018]|uniref:response regulator transcription factor n=1 Tax=Brachybacterium sp. NBEC-018 TaxID=2996004 RepID=UPI002174E4F0|nr:response regulator transcription factor [Brachybacterium sp. NBEC-018]UVY84244.1 response regulator transcription factor [Brachybacterium sp. NBEC-018]